jgi:anion transporter
MMPLLMRGSIIIFAIVLYIIPVSDPEHEKMMRTGALVVFTLGFWATAALPEYMTALIFFLIAATSKLAPAALIFSGFYSGAFWLVLGGLIIALAVKDTGLGDRLAKWLLGFLSGSYITATSAIVLLAMLMAFVMPSTMGRVLLMIPIVSAMATRLGFSEGSRGRTGMILAATMACYAPSCAVLPANVPNMVLAGASESLFNIKFAYSHYLKLHYLVIGIGKGLAIVVLSLLLFGERVSHTKTKQIRTPVPMSRRERKLVVILAAALALWLTDSFHGIPPAWIALAAGLACILPGSGVMPESIFNEKINFGVLIFVAGVLGVGAVVADSGLAEVLGRKLIDLMGFKPGNDIYNFFSLVLLYTGLGPLTTAPGLPAMMAPLSADIASACGFPLGTVLMTQVIGFSNCLFPFQVPPVIVGMKMGGVKPADGIRFTVALAAVSILILLPINYLWWDFIGIFALW